MNEIKNYDVYNKRMSKTLYDKCWWIDKIDDKVDVIVDYGCGDGSLFHMINSICPNKFTYIGIDNDANMLKAAVINVPNGKFYSSIDELGRDFWSPANLYSDNTVLVLNSVMHELFTYLSDKEQSKLFTVIHKKLRPKYIAIRDMYISCGQYPECNLNDITSNIENSKFSDRAVSYAKSNSAIHHLTLLNTVDYVTEFFLKYTYVENWEREKDEVYLWDWMDILNQHFVGIYNVKFENNFYIPFIRERIKNDFDIDWNINTHRKVLYQLDKS